MTSQLGLNMKVERRQINDSQWILTPSYFSPFPVLHQKCTPLIKSSPFHSRIFLLGSLPRLFLDPPAACCYMYHTASFNQQASYLLIHWWVYICSESSGPQTPCIWDFPAASNEFTRLWGAAVITGPEHGPGERGACFWPRVEAPTNVPIYRKKVEVWVLKYVYLCQIINKETR